MLDPLTFYVGRVMRTFGDNPEGSTQKNLTAYIDRDRSMVSSLTGELTWDYSSGLVRVDTPRSQGVAGFLAKAGRIELSDVAIESRNDFGTVMVMSLDDEPIATSKAILIQAMTEERPYGFKVEGNRITDLGGQPFGIRKLAMAVSLALQGTGEVTVIRLDENGYPAGELSRSQIGEGPLRIELAEDAIYHVVARQ
jgi:hypothetical protein